MPRLEIVHVGVGGHRPRAVEDARHLPAHRVEGGRVEHVGHHEVTLLAIEGDVGGGEHEKA